METALHDPECCHIYLHDPCFGVTTKFLLDVKLSKECLRVILHSNSQQSKCSKFESGSAVIFLGLVIVFLYFWGTQPTVLSKCQNQFILINWTMKSLAIPIIIARLFNVAVRRLLTFFEVNHRSHKSCYSEKLCVNLRTSWVTLCFGMVRPEVLECISVRSWNQGCIGYTLMENCLTWSEFAALDSMRPDN